MPRYDQRALRRGVLAVSVTQDLDVVPRDDGFTLPGAGGSFDAALTWSDLADACGPHDPVGPVGGPRLAGLLRLVRVVAELGPDRAAVVRDAAVLLALPDGHLHHLGHGWAVESLRGGALQLGVGVRGLLPEPAVPLPAAVLRLLGADAWDWWPQLRGHAERMSALAVEQLGQDGRDAGQLRPVGGCDVLALLAGRGLRAALARSDGSGMRALAVPTRTRGWYDLARVDPAYVGAAWSLTAPALRGVDRPLLVTADEVVAAQQRGDLARQAFDRPVSSRRPGSRPAPAAVPPPRPPGD